MNTRLSRRCLRNPVNDAIADELSPAGAAGCLDRLRMSCSNGMEYPDLAPDRSRHQRLRCFLFRSGRLVARRGCRYQPIAAGRETRRQNRGAQSGPRPSLVSGKTRAALSGAAILHSKASTASWPKIPRSESAASHGGHDVYAPNGFDDIANLIVRPNPGPNFSAASYEAKAARWKTLWPEITVLAADAGGKTVNAPR